METGESPYPIVGLESRSRGNSDIYIQPPKVQPPQPNIRSLTIEYDHDLRLLSRQLIYCKGPDYAERWLFFGYVHVREML